MAAPFESQAQEDLYNEYQLERAIAIAKARTNVNSCIEFVVVDPQRRRLRQSGCHVELQDHLDENQYALACFPRDHGKTTQVPIGRTLFRMGNDPEVRIKLVGSDDEMAMKRIRAVRGYIESSRNLHAVFPHLKRNTRMRGGWTDHALYVERESMDTEPTLEGRGIFSSMVGGRCDVLIGDDVCTFTNSVASAALRQKVKYAFDDVYMNLLTPRTGRVEYIYTPWHKADLSASLERRATRERSRWQSLRLAIEEVNGKLIPIWPERWGVEALQERRDTVSSIAFARAMLLQAIDDSTCQLLPWVPYMKVNISPEWLDEGVRAHWPRVTSVDPAIGKKKTSSETAILTTVLEPSGRKWIDPRYSFVGRIDSVQTADKLVFITRATGSRLVLVESNAYQIALIEAVTKRTPGAAGMPIEAWFTGANKVDPEIGILAMASEIARGGWALPMGAGEHLDDCTCILCKLCTQAGEYPVGSRTDVLMAWWIGSQAARRVDAILAVEAQEREHMAEDDFVDQDGYADNDYHGEWEV